MGAAAVVPLPASVGGGTPSPWRETGLEGRRRLFYPAFCIGLSTPRATIQPIAAPKQVKRGAAVLAGILGALACLTIGWILQDAVGIVYSTSTPSFVIQYTVSLTFFSVVLGEYLSRAVTKADLTAFAFAGFGVTLFVGLALVSWNAIGFYPTLAGVFAVTAIVVAVYADVLDLRGRKAELYRIYRQATGIFLASEAGLGYALPAFGVKNADAALGSAIFLGLVGIGVSLWEGPGSRYRKRIRLKALEDDRDNVSEGELAEFQKLLKDEEGRERNE